MTDAAEQDDGRVLIPDNWPYPVFSATQTDTFASCKRKWGIRSIDKVKAPPNKFASRGIDLHSIADKFLKDATVPPDSDAGKVFKASIPHLPAPGSGMPEEPFLWVPKGEPYSFAGKIDWHRVWGDIELCDHKSTSDLKWAKTPDELRKNIQAVIYCAYLLEKHPQHNLVRCRWLYDVWRPDRPKCKPVDFDMPRAHVEARFEEIKKICREMVSWRNKGLRGAELPYEVSHCDAYGGCPYSGVQCVLTDAERMRAHMAQLSLKEKMAARAGQPPAVNPPPTEAKAPEPQAALALDATATPTGPTPVESIAEAAPTAPVLSLSEKMAARAKKESAQAAPEPKKEADHTQKFTKEQVVAAREATPKEPKPAKTPSLKDVQAAVVYLSKEKAEDLALGFEMVATGLKAIAKHFREQGQ